MATHCLRLREYFDENGASAGIGLIVCDFSANRVIGPVGVKFSVFSFQQEPADSRRYTNGSTTMTRKRCTGKALAERRRRAMHLRVAGFNQEEIADKLGVERPVVRRDLQSLRETWRSGDSPDLEEARFTKMAKNEVQGRKDCSSTRHTGRWKERSAPRRWRNPGKKGGSTTNVVEGYYPQLKL
jgi:hypothetical protein